MHQNLTRTLPAFLDEDLEVAASSHGQHWPPHTGQRSTPVYRHDYQTRKRILERKALELFNLDF
jgi:hypothetical protein